MKKRAVTYARVSSNDKSRTGGENLQDQLRLCREYAQQHGYTVIAELAEDDRGASGATFDLPQLSEVLEMARNDQLDILVVRELDRLSRDLAKQLIVEQELKRAQVSIEYVLYDFPDTAEGRLNKNLRAMLAEYEREKIKQRMARGRQRKAQAGNVILHGKRVYGYRIVEHNGMKTLEIDPEEAEIVRMIFRWYVGGEGGVHTLARKLTDLGIHTLRDKEAIARGETPPVSLKRRPIGHWSGQSVYTMLKNETYAGVFYYGSTDIAVEVPAIIDRDLWDAAQTQRVRNKDSSKRNTKHDYLLRRRLTCAACGKKMHASARKGGNRYYYYYHCPARSKGVYVTDCPTTINFRADHVDAVAFEWVRELCEDEDELLRSLRVFQEQRAELNVPKLAQLEAIQDLLDREQVKRERLLTVYLEGHVNKDEFAVSRAQIDTVLSNLAARQAQLSAEVEADALTDEQIATIVQFTREIRAGLDAAEDDFSKRRALIEVLNATGELEMKPNGEKVLKLRVELLAQETDLLIVSSCSGFGRTSTGRWRR